jgi:mRNA interferase MazF
MAGPARGEIWMVNLDPVVGREQAGARPALILSIDGFNDGPADLVIVAPTTKQDKKIPYHVRVQPPEGGVSLVSFIKTEDPRSISKARLIRRLGKVESGTMDRVLDRLKILLGI